MSEPCYLNYSVKGAVTEEIRTRILARNIQADCCGEVFSKPLFKQVYGVVQDRREKFRVPYDKGVDSDLFTKTTWSKWWAGIKTPNSTSRAQLDVMFDNAASRWLRPNLQHMVSRNLAMLDFLHGDMSLNLRLIYELLDMEVAGGIRVGYVERHRHDFPGFDLKVFGKGMEEAFSSLNCYRFFDPGNPYWPLPVFLSFILEDCEASDQFFDEVAFDYVSVAIFQWKYCEKYLARCYSPMGKHLYLARQCISHIFSGVAAEDIHRYQMPPRAERIADALADLGMEVDVEAVRKRLGAVRATYFEGLSWITGLSERELVKKITPEFGF